LFACLFLLKYKIDCGRIYWFTANSPNFKRQKKPSRHGKNQHGANNLYIIEIVLHPEDFHDSLLLLMMSRDLRELPASSPNWDVPFSL